MYRFGSRALALIAFSHAVGACDGDDPTDVSPLSEAAGYYMATELRTVEGETEIDQLAEGGYLGIVLEADGSWSGTFTGPAGEGGENLHVQIDGTWDRGGTEVLLDHEVDFFLRDIPFEYDEGMLSGSCCSSPQIFVTLQRMGLD